MFREFAFTLAGAVVVSGVVALTLSPMMCSKLLKIEKGRQLRKLPRQDASRERKRAISGGCTMPLNYRPAMIFLLVCVLGATGLVYQTTQRELAPEEDQGALFALVNSPQYANLDYLELYMEEVGKSAVSVPGVAELFRHHGLPGSAFGVRRRCCSSPGTSARAATRS